MNPNIDDLEDGDGRLTLADGRDGHWYTHKDDLGSEVSPPAASEFIPAEGGAEGSAFAARMRGRTADGGNVYVALGLSWVESGGAYDASSCAGIAFWARKQGEGTGLVRFKLGDAQTVPEGGLCQNCYNDFGADLGFGNEWREYALRFDELRQQSGWGDSFDALDTRHLFHAQWQIKHARKDIDVWVDNVRFIGCSSLEAGQP